MHSNAKENRIPSSALKSIYAFFGFAFRRFLSGWWTWFATRCLKAWTRTRASAPRGPVSPTPHSPPTSTAIVSSWRGGSISFLFFKGIMHSGILVKVKSVEYGLGVRERGNLVLFSFERKRGLFILRGFFPLRDYLNFGM